MRCPNCGAQNNKPPRRKRLVPLLAIAAAAMLVCFLAGCDDDSQESGRFDSDFHAPIEDFLIGGSYAYGYDPSDTWAIYWYLCGSDLETQWGCASEDMEEMVAVQLPENVSVVIQTGGAAEWKNDVDANTTSRYLYDSGGLSLIEKLPAENMSNIATLTNFLWFCNENYPADHKAVIFWDHGGGSAAGVVFDENFEGDSLSLGDIYEAFNETSELSVDGPPYELIGFDACLMATVDVAYTCNDIARFLVASEETEPGCGWNYTGFLQALADNTGMNGAQLGKAICDSYYDACYEYGVSDEITLSVMDLSYADQLLEAYNNVGAEALLSVCADTSFFGAFGRAARSAENYGGNNKTQGYSNMVDLSDLVKNAGDQLPVNAADALLNTLDQCVAYQVRGPYRKNAGGLSCYYSYSGDYDDLERFANVGVSQPFMYFHEYAVTGELSLEGLQYIEGLFTEYDQEQTEPQMVLSPAEDHLEDWPVIINEDGYAVLELGPEIADKLTGVYFNLAYVDLEEDLIIFFGVDNDLDMDWETGVFMDNYRGVWGSIDDALVYMEITEEGEDYQVYAVPVLLNGEEYALSVSYTYNTERYEILGARRGIDENGMSDKYLRKLQPGDVVEPLLYVLIGISEEDSEFEQIAVESITVTDNTRFEEIDLGDGTFLFMFEMIDIQNNSYTSELVTITVENGDIYFDYE